MCVEIIEYPATFARGIINKDFLLSSGFVDASLFKGFEQSTERKDDFLELSINWIDCEDALNHLLCARKDNGDIAYKCGAAIVDTSVLDRVKRMPACIGQFAYERYPIVGNDYHGNLLLKISEDDPKKKLRDMIASTIALHCSKVETANPV